MGHVILFQDKFSLRSSLHGKGAGPWAPRVTGDPWGSMGFVSPHERMDPGEAAAEKSQLTNVPRDEISCKGLSPHSHYESSIQATSPASREQGACPLRVHSPNGVYTVGVLAAFLT